MNQPILIRSSLRTWDLALLSALGFALLVAAALIAGTGLHLLASIVATLGIACILGSVIGRRRRIRLRRWIQDTGTGFLITDSAGERSIEDSQVLSMAFST